MGKITQVLTPFLGNFMECQSSIFRYILDSEQSEVHFTGVLSDIFDYWLCRYRGGDYEKKR